MRYLSRLLFTIKPFLLLQARGQKLQRLSVDNALRPRKTCHVQTETNQVQVVTLEEKAEEIPGGSCEFIIVTSSSKNLEDLSQELKLHPS